MRDRFCISLRLEFDTLSDQFFTQRKIILNDAIMYDHDPICHANMRMCVLLAWRAVSCPACMTDINIPFNRIAADRFSSFSIFPTTLRISISPFCKTAIPAES